MTDQETPDYGAPPKLEWLDAEALVIDPRYQRDVGDRGRTKIRRIAGNFAWAKFGALVVAGPDKLGDYHVLDGQHRLEAARAIGIDRVPCCVVAAAGVAGEARAFVAINRERTRITPLHVFHAAVAAGQEREAAIQSILDDLGLAVGRVAGDVGKPRCIISVWALMEGHRLSPPALRAALSVLAGAQGDQGGGLRAPSIKALTRLFAEHKDAIDRARLEAALDAGEVDLDDWIAQAQATREMFGGKTEFALQARIVSAYNKGLHGARRLPAPAALR